MTETGAAHAAENANSSNGTANGSARVVDSPSPMDLTEIENIQSAKMLSILKPKQYRKIANRRQRYGEKMNQQPTLNNCFLYLDNEMYFYNLLTEKKTNTSIPQLDALLKNAIRRLKEVYKLFMALHSNNRDLTLKYLSFCKECRCKKGQLEAVQLLINKHQRYEDTWLTAANFYLENNEDFQLATRHLCTGLTRFPKSKDMYFEIIKVLVLTAVGKASERVEPGTEEYRKRAALCHEKAKRTLKRAIKEINESDLYIRCLTFLENYEFTLPLQKLLIEFMCARHSEEPVVWEALALRESRGFPTTFQTLRLDTCNTQGERIDRCVTTFEAGMTHLTSLNKSKLWALYMNYVLKLFPEIVPSREKKMQLFSQALKHASQCFQDIYECNISEEWIYMLYEIDCKELFEIVIENIPSSPEIWEQYLRFAKGQENNDMVLDVYERGVDQLKENSIELFISALSYFYSEDVNPPYSTIVRIYESGMQQPEQVSHVLRPKYLRWMMEMRGIDGARELYTRLATLKPPCKPLHKMMESIEQLCDSNSFENFEIVHKVTCGQFGESDVDVWLDYIKFLIHFKKPRDIQDEIEKIRSKAHRTLSADLIPIFHTKYVELLQEMQATYSSEHGFGNVLESLFEVHGPDEATVNE